LKLRQFAANRLHQTLMPIAATVPLAKDWRGWWEKAARINATDRDNDVSGHLKIDFRITIRWDSIYG